MCLTSMYELVQRGMTQPLTERSVRHDPFSVGRPARVAYAVQAVVTDDGVREAAASSYLDR